MNVVPIRKTVDQPQHRSYTHIAMLLLLMMKRSGKARLRISRDALRKISGRTNIQTALIDHLNDHLDPDATLVPLSRSGDYTLVAQSALDIRGIRISKLIPDWKSLSLEEIESQLED